MLEKLTPEQKIIMNKTLDEWLNFLFKDNSFDEKKCKEGVKWLYQLAKLKEPKIIILKSPLAIQKESKIIILESPLAIQYAANNLSIFKANVDAGRQVNSKIIDEVVNLLINELPLEVMLNVSKEVKHEVEKQVNKKVLDENFHKVLDDVRNQLRHKVKNGVNKENLKFPIFPCSNIINNYGMVGYYDIFSKIGFFKK